jgi:tellurite resistance protein TerC
MLAMPWFHMPIQWSLTIVGSIIAVSVVASLALSKPKLNTVAAGEEA